MTTDRLRGPLRDDAPEHLAEEVERLVDHRDNDARRAWCTPRSMGGSAVTGSTLRTQRNHTTAVNTANR
jgi:hypothetical protein